MVLYARICHKITIVVHFLVFFVRIGSWPQNWIFFLPRVMAQLAIEPILQGQGDPHWYWYGQLTCTYCTNQKLPKFTHFSRKVQLRAHLYYVCQPLFVCWCKNYNVEHGHAHGGILLNTNIFLLCSPLSYWWVYKSCFSVVFSPSGSFVSEEEER